MGLCSGPHPAELEFEGVVDVATGVGKTYVLATAIEYFAPKACATLRSSRPGRTILEKTVANFTP
jgi:type III restriction enzyme